MPFKVAVVGAGPAGLYTAILLKRLRADVEVSVLEQNRSDATFGFGVVFSDQALGFLREDDPETVALVEPHMQRWANIVISHKGERIEIDGVGFSAIGRLELLQLLQARAAELGVATEFGRRLCSADTLEDHDLIVGADGVNSVVRNAAPVAFGTQLSNMRNRFIWFGANCEFDALSQTFIESDFGCFNAHHYRYGPGKSTFIVETTDETWKQSGLGELAPQECKRLCEQLFEETLNGAELVSNNSRWRQFPDLSCDRFYSGNRVLVGDALHTAHFSIGSGTRLALEDAHALVNALHAHDLDVPVSLEAYSQVRRPAIEKIANAARASAQWYEQFDKHMALEPWQFARDYIFRAGRLAPEGLRKIAPLFAAQLDARGVCLST